MKRFASLLISVYFIFAVTLPCFAVNAKEELFSKEQIEYYKNLNLQGTEINVYNWGDYIADGSDGLMNVTEEFERLSGIKVNYTNFENNENMYAKLTGGGVSYDVITPSDYMVERLIDEGRLLKLDYGNIPNMKYVKKDCQNLYYDPNQEYSVCFNTGLTALIYNKKLVKETPTSWKVLWDEQYRDKVLMFNNSRDAFAIAQSLLGQDFNTNNEQDWVKAAELLAEQKDKVNPVYVMDEVFNLMESGEYAFATYYSGDYLLMIENNEDLDFCFPEEGVNLFYDAFCIPDCAQNKKGAEAFINFMHEPNVAFDNEEFIYYASANEAVEKNEDSSLYQNEAVYPKTMPEYQCYKNLPQNILELQNSLWSKVKSGQLSKSSKAEEKKIYNISFILLIITAAILIYRFIKKKMTEKEQNISELYSD